MEQPRVQCLRATVIAQVQAQYFESPGQKSPRQRLHVHRVGVTLPAMQHEHRTDGIRLQRRGVLREQAHLSAAVENHGSAVRQNLGTAVPDQGTPQRQTRHDRLDMRIAQPPGGPEAPLRGIFEYGCHLIAASERGSRPGCWRWRRGSIPLPSACRLPADRRLYCCPRPRPPAHESCHDCRCARYS